VLGLSDDFLGNTFWTSVAWWQNGTAPDFRSNGHAFALGWIVIRQFFTVTVNDTMTV